MNERERRSQWFQEARFGMFIHWGLYAIPARGEWVRSHEQLSAEAYEPFMEEFNTADYHPREWAKLCKAAGMKYAVMTAKHHDGFCLFESKQTDFHSVNAPCKRDLIGEYVEAFRAEGLKVGIYYSLIDWHHEDFPAFGDLYHPMRGNDAFRDKKPCFDRYLDYMHAQVRELMMNYGKIDLLWLDFSYEGMTGEDWRATELVRMIRQLQPDILLNSRMESSGESYGSLMTDEPTEIAGDFTCPEMLIPANGLTTPSGAIVPWECCTSINNSWGYNSSDKELKPASMIVRKLVECVSKNGNFLINIGPEASGHIPSGQVAVLHSVGEWMKKNGESIYGCGASQLPRPEWGRYTQRGNTLYAHQLEDSLGPVSIVGMKGKLASARNLDNGAEMYLTQAWNTKQFPNDEFVSYDAVGVNTYILPESPDHVIRLHLKE